MCLETLLYGLVCGFPRFVVVCVICYEHADNKTSEPKFAGAKLDESWMKRLWHTLHVPSTPYIKRLCSSRSTSLRHHACKLHTSLNLGSHSVWLGRLWWSTWSQVSQHVGPSPSPLHVEDFLCNYLGSLVPHDTILCLCPPWFKRDTLLTDDVQVRDITCEYGLARVLIWVACRDNRCSFVGEAICPIKIEVLSSGFRYKLCGHLGCRTALSSIV